MHNKPKEWPLLWLRINTWLLRDLGLQIMVQCAIQWWATLMDGQILPWRCAVVVALRPCVATLAGSRVWGDLPLSVRVYVHSYRRQDVWRWEVAAPGDPHGAFPVVATNRCHKHHDNHHDKAKRGQTDVESVDDTTTKHPTTRPTRGKYVDKKRCITSLKNGLCSGFAQIWHLDSTVIMGPYFYHSFYGSLCVA